MIEEAIVPEAGLYRVARWPDPLVWPPWEFVGEGRFDDPQKTFRTLYAGEQPRDCFVELLARFRPSVVVLARVREVTGATDSFPSTEIPVEWYRSRSIGRLRPGPNQRWLDLRSLATRQTLRSELAGSLVRLGLTDLDVSGIRSSNRELTQTIARWAYEHGYNGIAYRSRLDDFSDCWAIFEGAQIEPIGLPRPIVLDNSDLRTVASIYGLRMPEYKKHDDGR